MAGNHEILIRAVINFFAYLALSFDALGALFALLTARSLFKVSGDAQDLMEEKYNLDGSIIGQLDQPDLQLLDTLQSTVDSLYRQVERQDHILKKHTGGLQGVITFILLGVVCFFVALILQIIQSQPLKFWIPFIVIVFTMALILAREERGHHTGMWAAVKSRIRGHTMMDAEKAAPEAPRIIIPFRPLSPGTARRQGLASGRNFP
jgi:hypothetical protein